MLTFIERMRMQASPAWRREAIRNKLPHVRAPCSRRRRDLVPQLPETLTAMLGRAPASVRYRLLKTRQTSRRCASVVWWARLGLGGWSIRAEWVAFQGLAVINTERIFIASITGRVYLLCRRNSNSLASCARCDEQIARIMRSMVQCWDAMLKSLNIIISTTRVLNENPLKERERGWVPLTSLSMRNFFSSKKTINIALNNVKSVALCCGTITCCNPSVRPSVSVCHTGELVT